MGEFEYLKQHPQAAEVFNRAMADLAAYWHTAARAAYDFSQFGTIVDVGGGNGALLIAILQVHPAVRGVLFDLPHVVEGAK